jgi:predicted alpha/beta-hydrolase family hydrolase
MRTAYAYPAPMTAKRILLAPGASGSIEGLRQHEKGLAQRGYDVTLLTLPRGAAERAMPIYRAAVDDPRATVIGGQSFGGRVATLIAPDVRPQAVVCFSYPLHAPGRHAAWDDRTSHWPAIECPVLLLSGESDPFARLELLREAAKRLRRGRLITFPGLGHSLKPVLDAALDEVAAFLSTET